MDSLLYEADEHYKHGNLKQAAQLYQEAMDEGYVDAINSLALCYQNGEGVDKDEIKAVQLYQQAVDEGHVNAINNLALCYYNGEGVDKDEVKAAQLYQQAIDNGHIWAIFNLALCYHYGEGVSKDEAKAAQLYQQAMDKGHVGAIFNLAFCYQYGQGVSKDEVKAAQLFQQAMDKGNVPAINGLAICYKNGEGVEKDEVRAFELFQEAMDSGNSCATGNLGSCFQHGHGVDKDEDKAVEHYRKAIEMGDTDSKVRLGICYHRGEGVAKDETEALSLFLQAAEEGEAYALHNLGYYHEYGRGGIEVNREKAIQYYKMAADEGSRISITTMKEKHGLEYSPPAIKQNNFQVEEEKLMTLQPGDGDEVVCLIADCLSTSELEKLGRFFCSSPVPASQHNDLVRPIAAQILGLLESEGRKHPADGMDAAIVYMLTAAAGLKSADVNTQRRVEGAITALISSLPSLLEECQHNQAVLQGVRPRQRDSDAEENKLALSRAGVVEVMLHRPSSSFSSKFLDDMREKVQSQLSQLKDDLARVESENESRRKAEVAGKGDGWMPSSRDYLLGIQKEGAQFSKVTLPHIVNLSRQLNVDLLSLTDDDLKTALQVKDLGQPVATASDILRFLQKEVNKIEKKEDPSTRMCSTQSLSSFLSGSLPERGAMQDAALASAASHLAKHTRSCSSSAWRSEFEKYWSSLEAIWSAWSELEERIEKALSDKEASLDALRSLLSDLDDSTLFNADLRDKVASRMHALTLAATSSTCMTCGGKPSEVRFFPCRHSCSCLDCALRVLKTAEEKEELGSMGFVSLKGSDTVLSCFQCDRRVLSITQA